jgi:hypothetical protein
MTTAKPPPADVGTAIRRLASLHEEARGVLDVVACGPQAIPALRTLLFARDPSGIFEVRRRAVEALAQLGAHDVLLEFLNSRRAAADPVEQLGDDAVINAAAQALANARDERVFGLLLELARGRCLTGVIAALAQFRRAQAIPALVAALADDASRPVAAAALKQFGPRARSDLISAAAAQPSFAESESESSRRWRRTALRLLRDIGMSRGSWRGLRHLMRDPDAEIAMLACELCLLHGSKAEQEIAVHRLIGLLADLDWTRRDEIEDCLVAHYEITGALIEPRLGADAAEQHAPDRERTRLALLRVQSRAKSGELRKRLE